MVIPNLWIRSNLGKFQIWTKKTVINVVTRVYFQHLYKKVTALKSTEDGIKKSYATNKDRIDKVKKGTCYVTLYMCVKLKMCNASVGAFTLVPFLCFELQKLMISRHKRVHCSWISRIKKRNTVSREMLIGRWKIVNTNRRKKKRGGSRWRPIRKNCEYWLILRLV